MEMKTCKRCGTKTRGIDGIDKNLKPVKICPKCGAVLK